MALAYCYHKGNGVPKDPQKASEWEAKAITNGVESRTQIVDPMPQAKDKELDHQNEESDFDKWLRLAQLGEVSGQLLVGTARCFGQAASRAGNVAARADGWNAGTAI